MTAWLESKATFSDCKRYRYRLLRRWAYGPNWTPAYAPRTIAFCMLNPSTADEQRNDPTVERCEVRARTWGYDALIVVNLFAYRSTDPSALREVDDPVGYLNLSYIFGAVEHSSMFICGWGNHGEIKQQGSRVLSLLHSKYPGRAHALHINADGSPKHPLYCAYALKPQPIRRSKYA